MTLDKNIASAKEARANLMRLRKEIQAAKESATQELNELKNAINEASVLYKELRDDLASMGDLGEVVSASAEEEVVEVKEEAPAKTTKRAKKEPAKVEEIVEVEEVDESDSEDEVITEDDEVDLDDDMDEIFF